jgi:aminoglycoside 2''-phosphotransferase
MDSAEPFVKRIRQVYPEIEYLDAQVTNEHQPFDDVVVLNKEIVFVFPRTEADVVALRREVAVLKSLQGRLPLPIPNPEYVSLDSGEPGLIFFGYCSFAGVELATRLREGPLPKDALVRIASQMANFMHALHEAPANTLGVDLSRAETRQSISRLYEDIRQDLAPAMRPEAADWVEHVFKPYLADPENFAYKPVVRHGSLVGKNIFIDPQTAEVTGVAGFSTLATGDPAYDAAGLASISEAFFSTLFHVDQEAIGKLLWRAQFYKSTFALQEALAAFHDGDPETYQQAMASYLPQPEGRQT